MNNTFINALIKDNMLQLNKKGFTLIELLVVIAIIGVLGSIVFAPFNEARKKGRDGKRMSELKSIQSSLLLFSEDNSGCFPDTKGSSSENGYFAKSNNKYIPSTLFNKIISGNSAATLNAAANAWTINKPYTLRSVGDDAQCSKTVASDPSFPNYQLFVELETHTTGLDGDADSNMSTVLGKVANAANTSYDGYDISAASTELCDSLAYKPGVTGTTAGSYQCIYDISNL